MRRRDVVLGTAALFTFACYVVVVWVISRGID